MYSFTFDAIGTRWQIDISYLPGSHKGSTQQKTLIEQQIKNRIEEFDRTYSRFRPDSFIRKLSVNEGKFALPNDALPLFTLYSRLYKLTGGLFTPLIGQVLIDAGYDENYSLKPGYISPVLSWDDAVTINQNFITVKKPALLDFGASGKGYLIDIVSKILTYHKINSFCVDAGGDIYYRSEEGKPLRVGLENPDNFRQVIGVTNITNQSICASAGSRRKWGNFHHIINPSTLTSPSDIKAIWVIAGSTMIADALSTCLFFVTPEILLTEFNFEYTILYSDYSVKKSKGFGGELFLKT